ncbi:MAG: DUF1616 domain-containing protein [Parcubacteria group bacterium]|nr:DUF1616 domain-containing protein [Parcubacteria group bacterium]
MKNNLKIIIIYLAIIFALLLVIALIGSIKFPWQQSFRIVFGSFYVLFLPGFIWSYVFFDKKENKEKPLDGIERILLSFALSLALSPLILFFLNKVGVAINLLNSTLVILGIIIIGFGIIIYKEFFIKNKKLEK